mmetsp:Transcript_3987/g.4607  ORF Transcript_3987/g.4607 Transcript_3987/m.4607 type:complete len:278 (-) Transcript_3987:382-1215(-)
MSTKKLTRWIKSKQNLKEDYFEFVENVLKKPKEADLEYSRKKITPLEDTLRYVVENTHPSEKSFPTIDFYSLQAAFTLDPKEGAKPPTPVKTDLEPEKSGDNGKEKLASPTEDKPPAKKRKVLDVIDDEENDSDSDDDDAKKVERNKVMLAKKKKLLRAVEAMIKVKWPKALRPMVENFKQMGFESGNPFAVPLLPGCGWVADEYFDKIKQPIDLLTIRENIESFHTNELAQFENDVLRVISNSKEWSKHAQDSLRNMRQVQEKNISKALQELKKTW